MNSKILLDNSSGTMDLIDVDEYQWLMVVTNYSRDNFEVNQASGAYHIILGMTKQRKKLLNENRWNIPDEIVIQEWKKDGGSKWDYLQKLFLEYFNGDDRKMIEQMLDNKSKWYNGWTIEKLLQAHENDKYKRVLFWLNQGI